MQKNGLNLKTDIECLHYSYGSLLDIKTILRFKIVITLLLLFIIIAYKSPYHFVTFDFKRHVKMN